jgi:hypothetical protein
MSGRCLRDGKRPGARRVLWVPPPGEQIARMPDEEITSLRDANVRTLKMDGARLTRADLNREKPAPKR